MIPSVPGGADSVAFEVRGERLVGVLYRPPGLGPHPVVVLLHGIPGSEKNHDIAYALRDAGWQALIVHFRGSWGSGGRYDIPGQVDDALGALDWLLRGDNPYPVDPERVMLVGFSLGSRAALLAAARDERVSRVISIAGFARFSPDDLDAGFMEEFATVLNGVSGDDLLSQWASLANGDQPSDSVAKLGCPLLVVHSDADEVVPIRHADQLIAKADPNAEIVLVSGADHIFTEHRNAVVQTVLGWLTSH